jgi:hypothetical protein
MRALARSALAIRPRAKFLVLGAWGFFALLMFARAGLYPAVMTGDEVWFAEAARNFLAHGIPLRLIHADSVGSSVADFLPPIIMLVQSASFLVFGLTPLGVSAPSAGVPLLVMVLMFFVARRAGASTAAAGFASIAIFGSQLFLRAGMYIRYESLVAACFLAYLFATDQAARASGGRHLAWHFARGALVALAGLSYYPTAPFIGLAALLVECMRWREARPNLASLAMLALGFALALLPFGLYVAAYPQIFAAQILDNGAHNYAGFELIRRFLDPSLWLQSRDAVPEMAALALYFVVGFAFWSRHSPRQRLYVLLAALTALPVLIYPFQPRLLALPMLLAIVTVALWAEDRIVWLGRLAKAALLAEVAASIMMAAMILVTVLVQMDGRRYDRVTAEIDGLLREPGPVAFDQRAWLALRAAQPDREAHQVMAAGAAEQVQIFESEILRDPSGGSHFQYLILSAANLGATIEATPALKQAFAAGRFAVVARVSPRFTPLPWATKPPYDLIVFQRRS